MRHFMLRLIGLSIFFIAVQPVSALDLLWNSGPTRRCFQHYLTNPGVPDQSTAFKQTDDCPPGDNPPNVCPSFGTVDGSCQLWDVLTYGWQMNQKEAYPGWSFWNLSGGWGTPLEVVTLNSARTASPSCNLREVAFGWDWADVSFRRNTNWSEFSLGQFSTVNVSVSGKISNYLAPACTSLPTAFVSLDVIVNFPNGVGYSIGVLLYNGNGYDSNGNPNDNIFYSNYNGNGSNNGCSPTTLCQTLLQGTKIGLPNMTTAYQSYTVNFKTLFTNLSYLPPPPFGYSWNDGKIRHIQLVNSSRGADLRVYSKNFSVQGF